MATHTIDTLGLKCPKPVLKLAAVARRIPSGDVIELVGDCETFEADVRKWCQKLQKLVTSCVRAGTICTIRIQF